MEWEHEGKPKKGENEMKVQKDTDPYIPNCSWCGKPYHDCKCGK